MFMRYINYYTITVALPHRHIRQIFGIYFGNFTVVNSYPVTHYAKW